ncbi:MAG TPA: ornithine carbamoyltransferase [Acidimicrobiales bacterium]|nr:ornithine carbamoyltransferase [Acidimicrobiales bacterium]
MADLRGRSFLKEIDFTAAEFLSLIELSASLKTEKRSGAEIPRLGGKNIALIFEKTSTRTRAAFEVAAHDQGAHVTYLGPGETQLGRKESMVDTARVLGRMFDGIEYRGFGQERVETLGRSAGVPVWNGLTDQWHPTQMLADILTMREHCSKELTTISYCYMGDARNNTAHSLLVTGALLGMDVRIAAPAGLQPDPAVQRSAEELAVDSGARITVTEDVAAAVRGADFLYTDVWLSMGEPVEAWGERIHLLLPYQVTTDVVEATGNPDVKFMHCLPALHDRHTEVGAQLAAQYGLDALEVTDAVFESPRSIVFDQAENRLHTIKAVMVATLRD